MRATRGVLVLALLVLAACGMFGSKEAKYLCKAQDRATKAEVEERLGPPVSAQSTAGGESRVVYQVREQFSGSRFQPAGTWCDEYVLTFDRDGVLRHWTQRKYFHGGEIQPTVCVPS